MGQNRDSLGTRALACVMSLVLAVGLMPLPAFAEVSDEAPVDGVQLVSGVPTDDANASSVDERQEPTSEGEPSDTALLTADDAQVDMPASEGEPSGAALLAMSETNVTDSAGPITYTWYETSDDGITATHTNGSCSDYTAVSD